MMIMETYETPIFLFQKAKLLTKAYYRLLRGSNDSAAPTPCSAPPIGILPAEIGPTSLQVDLSAPGRPASAVARGDKKSSSSAVIVQPDTVVYHKHRTTVTDQGDFDRKRWQALINADAGELRRMVDGLGHTGTLHQSLCAAVSQILSWTWSLFCRVKNFCF